MSESSEVVGGGTSATAALEVSIATTSVEEGGGEALLEDAPRETE